MCGNVEHHPFPVCVTSNTKVMAKVYCMGIECPIKKQCLRYNDGLRATVSDGTRDKYLRKCTSQKKYIQDENNVLKIKR
jgi:hypothetical protein